MKKLGKWLTFILVAALFLPGLPTYARPAGYRFSINYKTPYSKKINQKEIVKVDEFNPRNWQIIVEYWSGNPYQHTPVNTKWLDYVGYGSNGSYDYRLTNRTGNFVDPENIVSRTKVTFFDIRDWGNKPFSGHADKTLYCYIEPLNFVPGDLTELQKLIQKVQAIKDRIQVAPGKTEDQVDKDSPFFSSQEELESLINALEQANYTVQNNNDQEFGPMAQAEIDPVFNMLNEAFGKLRFGTNDPSAPIVPGTPTGLNLRIRLYLSQGTSLVDSGLSPIEKTIPEDSEILKDLTKGKLDDLDKLTQRLMEEVMKSAPEGYEANEESFKEVASAYLLGKSTSTLVVRLVKQEEKKCWLEKKDMKLTAEAPRIIAYDIHEGEWVYTRLNQLQMKEGWGSPRDYSVAFFEKSGLAADYIYAGFAADGQEPQMVYGGAYLERFGDYADFFDKEKYGASLVVFVVPKMVDVEVEHVFPEGTRDILKETVSVPYDVWASLQHSSTFMKLNDIFKTRIQKVNEMGYTFREVKFYDGRREITGLLVSWDWANFDLGGERRRRVVARVFYDKAVAAAQEVPTGKKVDAATAPQAQIQAEIKAQEDRTLQGTVAVAGISMSNQENQLTSALPVTGEKQDSTLIIGAVLLMALGATLVLKKQ